MVICQPNFTLPNIPMVCLAGWMTLSTMWTTPLEEKWSEETSLAQLAITVWKEVG